MIYGFDAVREAFLVDNAVSGQSGPTALWDQWPGAAGVIELFAPIDTVEPDPEAVVRGALESALEAMDGRDGPAGDSPRGTAALDAWAEAMDGEGEVDRAGNAYTLAVLQAARLDGADFLADLAASLPDLAVPLLAAERAIRDQAQAIAPLITLFPFPSGGHGNVNNAGLRRAAAMALRRAANHERTARTHLAEALSTFVGQSR